MKSSGMRGLLAGLALGAAAALSPGGFGVGMPGATIVAPAGNRADKRQQTRRPSPPDVATYLPKTGWTNARFQRAARKARNQRKNRSAHRG